MITALRRAAFVAAGALLLLGCGAGGEQDAVRDVTEQFYAAVADKDGEAACSQLGKDTLTELEKQEREPCPKAVLGLKLSGSKAADASVYVTSARVELLKGDTVFLDEESDGWKIAAAGCKPAGDPDQEPYDCEVES